MEQLFIKFLSLGSLVIAIFILSFFISLLLKASDFYSNFFKKYGLHVVFVFSLVATLGSLVLSEILELLPCDLCWYQRMFMYPLVFISGFAIYKKDYKNGAAYSIMLSVIGAVIAIYHYLLQVSDSFKYNQFFCEPGTVADCSIPEFIEFGFVTIPFISLTAFVLVIISSYYVKRGN